MSALADELRAMQVCPEAIDWVGDCELEAAWRECQRGDWMIYYAARRGVDGPLVVRTTCGCATPGLGFVAFGETRPHKAIRLTRLWADGRASIEEVQEAQFRAMQAAIGWAGADERILPVSEAGMYAAVAAAYTAATVPWIWAYADQARRDYALRYTARMAFLSANHAAEAAGPRRDEVLAEQAHLVREMIPFDQLKVQR